MFIIECQQDNFLSIVEEGDVICDQDTVQIGDSVAFMHKHKRYEGIVKANSGKESMQYLKFIFNTSCNKKLLL